MALVWRCDRCRVVSEMGMAYEQNEGENEPPDGWHKWEVPVRGSEGRVSYSDAWFCDACEDSLYHWLHHPEDDG